MGIGQALGFRPEWIMLGANWSDPAPEGWDVRQIYQWRSWSSIWDDWTTAAMRFWNYPRGIADVATAGAAGGARAGVAD